MAETALADGVRDVIFIHYARNGDVHAFGEQIDAWAKAYPQFRAQVVYEQGGTAEGDWPSRFGRPDIAHLEEWLPESRDCDAYFLGPKPFMAFIRKSLLALGLPEERIHFEFFGPAEALT
jgi:nitric oxide dioxygenase